MGEGEEGPWLRPRKRSCGHESCGGVIGHLITVSTRATEISKNTQALFRRWDRKSFETECPSRLQELFLRTMSLSLAMVAPERLAGTHALWCTCEPEEI